LKPLVSCIGRGITLWDFQGKQRMLQTRHPVGNIIIFLFPWFGVTRSRITHPCRHGKHLMSISFYLHPRSCGSKIQLLKGRRSLGLLESPKGKSQGCPGSFNVTKLLSKSPSRGKINTILLHRQEDLPIEILTRVSVLPVSNSVVYRRGYTAVLG
jgi:hypothetical protein